MANQVSNIMPNPISQPNTTAYLKNLINTQNIQAPIDNLTNSVSDNVPVARKFTEQKDDSSTTLALYSGGMTAGYILGKAFEKSITPDGGKLFHFATKANIYSPKIEQLIASLKLRETKNWLNNAIKSISGNNFETFKEGVRSKSLLNTANANFQKATNALAEAIANNKPEKITQATKNILNAKNTISTIEKIQNLGAAGKIAGKIALFFRNEFIGTAGIVNGLMAATTVQSVMKAKKGEKFSTFMEDFLGMWVGNLGGFRLFDSLVKGLAKVNESGATNGILPIMAKIVNKIPAKGFVVPLIGAITLSSVFQKISHMLFGKPTKIDTTNTPQTENLNDWLTKNNWNFPQTTQLTSNNTNNNNQQPEYMPQKEVPASVTSAYTVDKNLNQVLKNSDKALDNILKQYNIQANF